MELGLWLEYQETGKLRTMQWEGLSGHQSGMVSWDEAEIERDIAQDKSGIYSL